MKEHLEYYEMEVAKFNKGNSAAGTRARKALMALIKAAKTERQRIQETKNG